MRTNAVTRWTARAVGLLGIGLLVQVSLAHGINLLGVHYTGEGWVMNAQRSHIPELILGEADRNRPPAVSAALPELSTAVRENDPARTRTLLDSAHASSHWWAVSTSARHVRRDRRLDRPAMR